MWLRKAKCSSDPETADRNPGRRDHRRGARQPGMEHCLLLHSQWSRRKQPVLHSQSQASVKALWNRTVRHWCQTCSKKHVTVGWDQKGHQPYPCTSAYKSQRGKMACLGQQQSWDLSTSPCGGCTVHPSITPAALQSWLSALCRWGKKLHLRSSWLFHPHPPGTYSGPESFGIVLFHLLQTRPVPAKEGLDQRWSTAQLPSRQEEVGQVPVPALGS